MLNRKEITIIIVVSIVLGFAFSFSLNLETIAYGILAVFLIILINTLAKKVASYYLDSEVEIKIWEINQYGFKPSRRFDKKFGKSLQAGLILPFILSIVTFGYLKFFTPLAFEVKPKVYRAVRRFGLYSFSEMTETHIALIAAAGIVANLIFAIIGYLIGLPAEMNFVKLSVFYIFFNMLPVSELDGNKIFFGSLTLWSLLATISLIALAYAILLV